MSFTGDVLGFNASNASQVTEYLASGKYIEGVAGTYNGLIGLDLYLTLLLSLLLALVYIKSRSLDLLSVVAIAIGPTVGTSAVYFKLWGLLIFVVSVTLGGLLYSLFVRER